MNTQNNATDNFIRDLKALFKKYDVSLIIENCSGEYGYVGETYLIRSNQIIDRYPIYIEDFDFLLEDNK
jgi:hypothetical protein